MAEISLEEIIREAKKRKIDLGADPEDNQVMLEAGTHTEAKEEIHGSGVTRTA
jgi:hypothetical protein